MVKSEHYSCWKTWVKITKRKKNRESPRKKNWKKAVVSVKGFQSQTPRTSTNKIQPEKSLREDL